MRRIVTLAALVILLAAVASADNASRTFDATYTATITNIPGDAGVLNVWIPLPTSRAGLQDVSDVKIDSSYTWQRMRESEFGDEYIFAKVPAPQTGELVVRVSFRATRRGVAFQNIGSVELGPTGVTGSLSLRCFRQREADDETRRDRLRARKRHE